MVFVGLNVCRTIKQRDLLIRVYHQLDDLTGVIIPRLFVGTVSELLWISKTVLVSFFLFQLLVDWDGF